MSSERPRHPHQHTRRDFLKYTAFTAIGMAAGGGLAIGGSELGRFLVERNTKSSTEELRDHHLEAFTPVYETYQRYKSLFGSVAGEWNRDVAFPAMYSLVSTLEDVADGRASRTPDLDFWSGPWGEKINQSAPDAQAYVADFSYKTDTVQETDRLKDAFADVASLFPAFTLAVPQKAESFPPDPYANAYAAIDKTAYSLSTITTRNDLLSTLFHEGQHEILLSYIKKAAPYLNKELFGHYMSTYLEATAQLAVSWTDMSYEDVLASGFHIPNGTFKPSEMDTMYPQYKDLVKRYNMQIDEVHDSKDIIGPIDPAAIAEAKGRKMNQIAHRTAVMWRGIITKNHAGEQLTPDESRFITDPDTRNIMQTSFSQIAHFVIPDTIFHDNDPVYATPRKQVFGSFATAFSGGKLNSLKDVEARSIEIEMERRHKLYKDFGLEGTVALSARNDAIGVYYLPQASPTGPREVLIEAWHSGADKQQLLVSLPTDTTVMSVTRTSISGNLTGYQYHLIFSDGTSQNSTVVFNPEINRDAVTSAENAKKIDVMSGKTEPYVLPVSEAIKSFPIENVNAIGESTGVEEIEYLTSAPPTGYYNDSNAARDMTIAAVPDSLKKYHKLLVLPFDNTMRVFAATEDGQDSAVVPFDTGIPLFGKRPSINVSPNTRPENGIYWLSQSEGVQYGFRPVEESTAPYLQKSRSATLSLEKWLNHRILYTNFDDQHVPNPVDIVKRT